MSRSRTGLAVGALLSVVASGQGLTAFAASSTPSSPQRPPASSPSLDRARSITSEQSRVASASQVLGLGEGERLVVKDVITDADGSVNVRYDRTFDGLRVIGGDLVSHRARSGKIEGISWNGSKNVAVASTKPQLGLASAKKAGARKAAMMQETTAATKGELVIYSRGTSVKSTPKLAYDVLTTGTQADQTPSRLHTIVDASTGATLASYDEIANGTGHGIYAGSVPIETTPGARFTMRDSHGNDTTDLNGATSPSMGMTFSDTDDIWGNGTVSDRASAGVDAHYGAGKTFDFYKNVLGRNGIWDTGVGARSRVHYGDGYANAFWDGTQMTYGDGIDNAQPLVELDVAGHELTHGVTEATAGLIYDGEAGGLNEATSDIFGTSVEWYADNAADTPDYLLGELIDINGDGTPLRYMDRPSRDGVSPDCWSSTLQTLNPHLSSGPLNHWFYLASEGSGAKVINGVSYTSPTCNASTVTPVGREKAAKIWYRALTTYLTTSSTYAAAREGAIQSAKDLYGADSVECTRTAASFSAIDVPAGATGCGVAPPPESNNVLGNPGFESGNFSWSATHDVVGQWGAGQPTHSGTWTAWLGGFGTENTSAISQLVDVPEGRSAFLSYYVHVETAEYPGASVHDTMTVRVGSTVLQTLSNLDAASGYQLKTIDLRDYMGQKILLSFTGVEDLWDATSFILDDTAVTWVRVTRLSDFNNDGFTDLVARDKAGRLWLYPGTGTGRFLPRRQIGTGWNVMTALVTPGDATGDGRADLIARDRTGVLWLYRGTGGGLGARQRVSSGWQMYTITNAGDVDMTGGVDLLARDSAGGLWRYPILSNGLIGTRTRIGTGWSGYSLQGPGDFSGDGRTDLLARDSAGSLWLYRGNGTGRLSARTLVSTGWAGMTALVTPGDWNLVEGNDLLARDAAGRLWLYPGNNAGHFRARILIGSGGWNAMTYLG